MLDDTDRKVLRVLWSIQRDSWAKVDEKRITRMAVRSPGQVRASLRRLLEEEYIQRHMESGMMRVIEPHDRRPLEPEKYQYEWERP